MRRIGSLGATPGLYTTNRGRVRRASIEREDEALTGAELDLSALQSRSATRTGVEEASGRGLPELQLAGGVAEVQRDAHDFARGLALVSEDPLRRVQRAIASALESRTLATQGEEVLVEPEQRASVRTLALDVGARGLRADRQPGLRAREARTRARIPAHRCALAVPAKL